MPESPVYDFVIAGAGASGLLMAYRMCTDPWYADKNILIIDKEVKNEDDRTWCYWEQGKGPFDNILHHHWEYALVRGADGDNHFAMDPYQYKMIRSSRFYKWVKSLVDKHDSVKMLQTEILELREEPDHVVVFTASGSFTAKKVLSSITGNLNAASLAPHALIYQHFTGWFVSAENPVFDPETITMMDFDIPQLGNTRFMYVLPFSATEALVEYTLFSAKLLEREEYEEAIRLYLDKLAPGQLSVKETEYGVIPMTCYPFWEANTHRIVRIGTAGGWTKASTGYTFRKSVQLSAQLSEYLKAGHSHTWKPEIPSRFRFYDAVLLEVLDQWNERGAEVFSGLFKNSGPTRILKFLDEETTISEEVSVITGAPVWLFIKGLFKYLLRR